MCNKNLILLKSKYTTTQVSNFRCIFSSEKKTDAILIFNFLDDGICSFSIFLYFFDILAPICPRCLLCVFVAIYVEFRAISVVLCRLLVPKYLVQEERFSTKLRVRGTSSKWRQMTIVFQKIPVCIVFDHLCTKVKISFYCLNEAFFSIISNSGLSSTSLLLVYLVNSPKKRL